MKLFIVSYGRLSVLLSVFLKKYIFDIIAIVCILSKFRVLHTINPLKPKCAKKNTDDDHSFHFKLNKSNMLYHCTR